MAELLYGTPVDIRRLASDVRLPEQLVREYLASYAGKQTPQVTAEVLDFPASGTPVHSAQRSVSRDGDQGR